jgi:hypothetical protein
VTTVLTEASRPRQDLAGLHLKLAAARAARLADPMGLVAAHRRELLGRLRQAQRALLAEPDESAADLLLEGVPLRLQTHLRRLWACGQFRSEGRERSRGSRTKLRTSEPVPRGAPGPRPVADPWPWGGPGSRGGRRRPGRSGRRRTRPGTPWPSHALTALPARIAARRSVARPPECRNDLNHVRRAARAGHEPARNVTRTFRCGLSLFVSTRHTDCQVPRARRPSITGRVACGGTIAGRTWSRP